MLRFRQLLLFGLLAAYLVASPAADALQFEDAWSPEAPPVAPVMAGYVRISNSTTDDVAITGARCPDFNSVEIHDMFERDGMIRMVRQDRLTIPAGKTVELKKGGLHLMLMKPQRAINNGETLKVTFELANGDAITVPFTVKPRPADGMQHDQQQHHHH